MLELDKQNAQIILIIVHRKNLLIYYLDFVKLKE